VVQTFRSDFLAGERNKAGEAFAKLADWDPQGNTFNDVAYQMAEADLKLPLALDYAKKAARAAEQESQKITRIRHRLPPCCISPLAIAAESNRTQDPNPFRPSENREPRDLEQFSKLFCSQSARWT
jgi:hypothetical protein